MTWNAYGVAQLGQRGVWRVPCAVAIFCAWPLHALQIRAELANDNGRPRG